MMLIGLDHSPIYLHNEDMLDFEQEGDPPLFSLEDLENLEAQAARDIGASTS